MLWFDGPPKTASLCGTRVHVSPLAEVHTAASESPLVMSLPTATRPGPPAVTAYMPWEPGPPNTASLWGTRVHEVPFTEVHTAAALTVLPWSQPTATTPGPPAVTPFIVWLRYPPKTASLCGTRVQIVPLADVHTAASSPLRTCRRRPRRLRAPLPRRPT